GGGQGGDGGQGQGDGGITKQAKNPLVIRGGKLWPEPSPMGSPKGRSSVQFLNTAAGDRENLAADPGGGGRTQEQRRPGDIVGRSEPTQRRVFQHGLFNLRRQDAGQGVGLDGSRRDGVHADA